MISSFSSWARSTMVVFAVSFISGGEVAGSGRSSLWLSGIILSDGTVTSSGDAIAMPTTRESGLGVARITAVLVVVMVCGVVELETCEQTRNVKARGETAAT